MQLNSPFRLASFAISALVLSSLCFGVLHAQDSSAPDPESVLKHFVIVDDGKNAAPLPKIGVQPSLDSNIEDVTVHSVVRRDLDLCGEFQVLADDDAPDGLYLSDTPVDVAAWKKKGAESVVKIGGKKLKSGRIALTGSAYFTDAGDKPVFEKTIEVSASDVRVASHQMADALIGALTGTPGGFDSQMTFVFGIGKQRRVYVIDSDGHNPTPVSESKKMALSPDFGKDGQLYYAASVKKGAYKVYGADPKPLSLTPRGSVYGLAFNAARDKVAVSIAQGPSIKLFTGPDLSNLKPASDVAMAMHPAWSPTGKLAFAGEGKWGQRIYVDGKATSPAGLNAAAPVFCRHPDGTRLVYMVWVGKNSDLLASQPGGHGGHRLTHGQGRNTYPACSPDGRMVAFFTTRKTKLGPGLYVMRLDGTRPKRVSTLLGDSLRWARR